jgi:hypothetical protein
MNQRLDPGDALNEAREIDAAPFIDEEQAAATAGQASHGGLPESRAGAAAEGGQAVMAFSASDRASRRRWVISAAIVLLVHGGIAGAILTWREAIRRAEPPGPVVIELSPAPVAPAPQQTELPPAPEQVTPNAVPEKPTEKVEEKTGERAAARGEEKVEPKPIEELPRVTPPATVAPPASAEGENKSDTKAATGGGAPAAAQANRDVNPIDTRMAERPRLRFSRAAKANDWKKTIMGRPLKNFAGRQQPPGLGVPGGKLRNAIGLPQPNAAAGVARNAVGASAGVARNAVGAPMSAVRAAAANAAINHPSAIGANHASVTGANVSRRATGPAASIVATIPNATINGTSMTRPGVGAGVIGGPAKNVAGVLNGTGMNRRSP